MIACMVGIFYCRAVLSVKAHEGQFSTRENKIEAYREVFLKGAVASQEEPVLSSRSVSELVRPREL